MSARWSRPGLTRIIAVAACVFATIAARAAPAAVIDVEVELPAELQVRAGHAGSTSVAHARVRIALPATFDVEGAPPVLLVSATADAGDQSSRALLGAYADVASANGWIVVAADPVEPVVRADDDVALRLVLDMAALVALAQRLPRTVRSPLAFAGFSGGAKFAGWLAAAFARQGRTIAGVYQAGINEDTLSSAAARFDVTDPAFRRVPVLLQSGRRDEIATPVDHREVAARLKRAGFSNVRVVYFDGGHRPDAAPLGDALRWFREVGGVPTRNE